MANRYHFPFALCAIQVYKLFICRFCAWRAQSKSSLILFVVAVFIRLLRWYVYYFNNKIKLQFYHIFAITRAFTAWHTLLLPNGVCQMPKCLCFVVFLRSSSVYIRSIIFIETCTRRHTYTTHTLYTLSNIEFIYLGLSYRTNMLCCIVFIEY